MRSLRYQAELTDELPGLDREAGGAERLKACGKPFTGPFLVPVVAWNLHLHTQDVCAGADPAGRRLPRQDHGPQPAPCRRCAASGPSGRSRDRAEVADRDRMREPGGVSAAAGSAPALGASGVALLRRPAVLRVAGVLAIMALSVSLRTHAITAKFWIDEGLSVGIAHHPLFDIPGVLRKDGSPPLYYMLLHVWMSVVGGDGESRTHAFSVLFATLTIPAGWLAAPAAVRRACRLGDRGALRDAAVPDVLRARDPDVRLGRVPGAGQQRGVRDGLRGARPALAGAVQRLDGADRLRPQLGAVPRRRHGRGVLGAVAHGAGRRARAAAARRRCIGFGLVVALYLPWLPTLLFQAQHTGAPWSAKPPGWTG